MFKAFKSAAIWWYLIKFRKSFAAIFLLVIFLFVIWLSYNDIVEFLKLSNRLDLLKFALFFKWLLILAVLIAIFYIIKNMISFSKKDEKTQEIPQKTTKNQELDPREKKILEKDKLLSKADLIIKKYSKK